MPWFPAQAQRKLRSYGRREQSDTYITVENLIQ